MVRKRHRCGKKCSVCKKEVDAMSHQCFLQPKEFKAPCEKLLFFDFETDQSSGEHLPIYLHCTWYDDSEEKKCWEEESFWVKDYEDFQNVCNMKQGNFYFQRSFQGIL